MVPIIINPIYTLYSGYLLGISLFKGLLGEFKQLGYHPRVPAFALWISATCFSSNHLSCKTEDIAWIYRAFQGSDWHPGLGWTQDIQKYISPPKKKWRNVTWKGTISKGISSSNHHFFRGHVRSTEVCLVDPKASVVLIFIGTWRSFYTLVN